MALSLLYHALVFSELQTFSDLTLFIALIYLFYTKEEDYPSFFFFKKKNLAIVDFQGTATKSSDNNNKKVKA